MSLYKILPQLVLRTPYHSFAYYSTKNIENINSDPAFKLALYLASPLLYKLLAAKGFDAGDMSEKEKLSLLKYYNRMCYRPTPFGNFAALTAAKWGNDEQIRLTADSQLHIQPDNEITVRLGDFLNDHLPEERFFLSPTLYKQGHKFRFTKQEEQENGTKLNFSLSSIDADGINSSIVSFTGDTLRSSRELTEHIQQSAGCTAEEAIDYLDFLKKEQVLHSDLACNISGRDYLERLLALPSLANYQNKAFLPDAISLTSGEPALSTVFDKEVAIKLLLEERKLKIPEKVFYCNTERDIEQGSLNSRHQEELIATVECLRLLVPVAKPKQLDDFIKDFNKYFEGQKIPLLKALDPDYGVGYSNLTEQAAENELLKNIHFAAKKDKTTRQNWTAAHILLMEKWLAANESNPAIILDDTDLKRLKSDSETHLSASISVMFRVVDGKLLIENVGGATGIALIGRFTAFSPKIWETGREIAAHEQQTNPGVLFAEIGQLSDNHIDNVNKRQQLYDYEIPINSVSLLPLNQQINPRDMVVSVKDNRIILNSVKHQKVIIPRLSSTYNFNHNQLVLYRFLCDLQFQDIHGNLGFDMENFFPGLPYYPRVQFRNTIIAPAKWHIKPEDVKNCFNKANEPDQSLVSKFRSEKELPAVIALTSADQQLVFDLDNDDEAILFIKIAAGLKKITVQEFFKPSAQKSTVVLPNGQPVINQFIAFILNNKEVFKSNDNAVAVPVEEKKRQHMIGSDWLYLKIYCSPGMADSILVKKILPAINKISKEKPVKWFFIRYADPKPHIRLRINITANRMDEVTAVFKKQFSGDVLDHSVKDYQADTYRRELERYGTDIVDEVEDFFYASSVLISGFIKKTGNSPEMQSHLAIYSMQMMLGMAMALADQAKFLEVVTNSFITEFNADKPMRVELDTKYRIMKNEILQLVNDADWLKKLNLNLPLKLFTDKLDTVLKRSAHFDEARKTALLASIIHMHLNRIFTEHARRQEFVVYYCLHKFKLSEIARSKARG